MDDEYQNFLAELGGTVPESSTKQNTTLALGSGSSGSNPPWATSAGSGGSAHPGLGSMPVKPTKEYDETNLYIGYLPPMLDDDGLINLFSSFGEIVMAKVIKDRVTGLSKGYGFVKYADLQMANSAIQAMNGYRLEGRTIAVRVAGKPPQPPAPPTPPAPPAPTPTYPPSSQPPGAYPAQQYATGGQLPNPPHAGYSTASVPWAPPVHSPYASYAPPPPPPGSYPPVPGQPLPPYGMQYPPPPPPAQTPPPGAVSQNATSSEVPPSFPPGVQSDSGTSASSVPTNIYLNPPASLPGQPPYMGYSSYFNAVPHPPPPPVPVSSADHSQSMGNLPWATNPPLSMSDHSQGLGNVPWAPNPPMPTAGHLQSMANTPWAPKPPMQPPVSSSEKQASVGDAEYEKFMAEMK